MNINIKIEKETRKVFSDKYVIGNDAENLQGNLIFTFDEFVDGQARLEFEANDIKDVIYPEKNGETYQAPILSKMTKEGQIDMQLVITEGTDINAIPVFKSNVFSIICHRSLNVENEQPKEYPSWIEIANTKLNQIDNLDISIKDGVVTITKKDGTTESENVKGEPNTLTIGEVTKGDEAEASITGESPNQTLNLVLPKGDKGNGINNITRYYLATDVAGGSQVIEWDGDTTGRENYQSFYKVSDKIPNLEKLFGATVDTTFMGTNYSVPIVELRGMGAEENYMAYSNEVSIELALFVTETTENVPLSPGVYFPYMSGMVETTKLTIAGGGISTDAEGWTTEIQTMTPTNKYLWSYEVVTFDDGTTNTSAPVIIGTCGNKGDKGDKGDTYTITDEDYKEIETNVKSDIQPVLTDIENIAKQSEVIARGRATGYVFDTVEDLDLWLQNSENVSKLVLGDNFYIRAVNVPDYWWDGTTRQQLEAEKPDLTDYAKTEQFVTLTQTEYDNLTEKSTNTYYFIVEEE